MNVARGVARGTEAIERRVEGVGAKPAEALECVRRAITMIAADEADRDIRSRTYLGEGKAWSVVSPRLKCPGDRSALLSVRQPGGEVLERICDVRLYPRR